MGTKARPRIRTAEYTDGALCVFLDGRVLSINVPPYSKTFQPGVFAVKNWSESADFAREALDTGLFEEIGVAIPTGHVEAPIWRIVDGPKFEAHQRYGTEPDDTDDVTDEVDEEIRRRPRHRA